jgi:hypothetical protein
LKQLERLRHLELSGALLTRSQQRVCIYKFLSGSHSVGSAAGDRATGNNGESFNVARPVWSLILF